MASDIPAFLKVGTPVSAKFKGAFCEATIKSLKKFVKCKVLYKDSSGSAVISDDLIQGELKLNGLVQVKQDHGESKDASIQKMNDHSQYTVVFDDGDERTLRRTNVCVMGERHFQEHENLDNLPLTDPENFLSPVVLPQDKRRKRKRSQPNLDEEDSDSDGMKSNKRWEETDKQYLGKVVCVEQGERKKSWFPALGLKHFGKHSENQIYVQSFKDGKKLLVKKTDIKEFCKSKDPILCILKGETKAEPILRSAIEKALSYHDMGELPKGWNILDTIDEKEDSSDDDAPLPVSLILTSAEKTFQDNVYNFLSKQGNPIVKPPLVNSQPIVLQRLFECVTELGGFEEVTNPQWRNIYKKMGLRNMHTTTSFNMKTIYKRYLLAYEELVKTNVKASPSCTKGKNKRNTKENNEATDKSESDSEPDRRRSTRSTRSNFDKNLSFELNTSRRRSNVSLVELPLIDDGADKSTCSSKDLSNDHDLDMKSEVEDIDVVNSPESSVTSEDIVEHQASTNKPIIVGKYKAGAKISVRYGSGKNLRHYTAKILELDREENDEVVYFIHYNGWNRRYNEWIKDERIAGLSTNIPNKKKHVAPPTPITKIAKDPPLRYKTKIDTDSMSTSSSVSKNSPTEIVPILSTLKLEKPLSVVPLSMPVLDKPPSPIKLQSSFHQDPLPFTHEPITNIATAVMNKSLHLKTAVKVRQPADALLIPDIKPSPIKPRMTRNSMQDTFLLNALEESIGKPNPAAINLQADVLLKSETTAPANRRRSHRQPSQHSPKSEPMNESDGATFKDEKDDSLVLKKEEIKSVSTFSNCSSDIPDDPLNVASIETLNHKESSKVDSVKKWIEDSSKLLSTKRVNSSELLKPEIETTAETLKAGIDIIQGVVNENASLKRGRKAKLKKSEDCKKKKKINESDSEDGLKEERSIETLHKCIMEESNSNNNLLTEKDRTSETAQTLSDFCYIVENVHKLDTPAENNAVILNTLAGNEEQLPSPTKEVDKQKRIKHDKPKRKRTKSFVEEEQCPLKSPKKERKSSSVLEYSVDFISDLGSVLKNKNPLERITIMQTRLNSMRELYCKLRTEVASIDRRKRRKLREQ